MGNYRNGHLFRVKRRVFPYVISVMKATVDREIYHSKKYGVQSSSSLSKLSIKIKSWVYITFSLSFFSLNSY